MKDRKHWLDGIRNLASYFERHKTHEPLFAPEHKASIEVSKIMETAASANSALYQRIQDVVSSVEKVPHYNGSGWQDLKTHINNWCKAQ